MLDKGYEDGINSGLGLIKGEVKYMGEIHSDKKMIIPHVGWNIIKSNKQSFDSDILIACNILFIALMQLMFLLKIGFIPLIIIRKNGLPQ